MRQELGVDNAGLASVKAWPASEGETYMGK